MNIVSRLLSLLCIISTLPLSAFIIDGSIWRKWDENNKEYRYIFCFGDIHLQKDNLNEEHQKKIFDLLAILGKNKTFTVTEDTTHYNGSITYLKHISSAFEQQALSKKLFSPSSSIEFLFWNCANQEYSALNAECRHAFVLPGFLFHNMNTAKNNNNLNAYQKIKSYFESFTSRDLVTEYLAIRKTILSYQDEPLLSEYYDATFKKLDTQFKDLIMLLESYDGTFFDFIEHTFSTTTRQYQFCYLLNTFEEFLDMRILHAVSNYTNTYNLIVAGILHIHAISPILKQLGYERIYNHTKLNKVDIMNDSILYRKALISCIDSTISDSTIDTMIKQAELLHQQLTQNIPEPIEEQFWQLCAKPTLLNQSTTT